MVHDDLLNRMQDELFKDTKERLSKRISLKGKQFEKIKFAIVHRSAYSKPTYLTDGMQYLLFPLVHPLPKYHQG